MISKTSYKFQSWNSKFPDGKIKLDLNVDKSWEPLLNELLEKDDYKDIIDDLEKDLKSGINILPYPDLVFNAFKLTKYDDIKAVIIGQDPYFRTEKSIPQAMGLSFSVPDGLSVPSSLVNIYQNMVNFKHLDNFPQTGNLENWASQGCLMLNTSLTVKEGKAGSHLYLWQWFTDAIIKKISDEKEGIVFLLWGGPALKKMTLIDTVKHRVIISSHPSGLSCHKPLGTHPSFMAKDHFGSLNKHLKELGKTEIEF